MQTEAFLVALALMVAPDDSDRARLDAILRALPTSGAVEATLSQTSGMKTVTAVGYDFATGAWYKCGAEVLAGVEPDGRAFYRETAKPSSLVFNPTDDRLDTASAVRDVFPWVLLDLLKRNPTSILDVTSSPESPGMLVVRASESAPGKNSVNAGKVFTQVMRIDGRGRVVEVGYEPDAKATAVTYTYEDQFEGLLPLAGNPDIEITSRRWITGPFDRPAESIIDHARSVGVAKLRRDPIPPPLPPKNASEGDPTDSRWSRTFIITGAVVCAVGVFAWIRARRRA